MIKLLLLLEEAWSEGWLVDGGVSMPLTHFISARRRGSPKGDFVRIQENARSKVLVALVSDTCE